MIDLQNLSYAVVQVVHNFGAAAVVGGAAIMLLARPMAPSLQNKIARIVGSGWLAQILSGIGFGVVSYISYGALPDIHGIATAALYFKMLCATGGVILSFMLLRHAGGWSDKRCRGVWQLLLVLGVLALTAAAFLRWFS